MGDGALWLFFYQLAAVVAGGGIGGLLWRWFAVSGFGASLCFACGDFGFGLAVAGGLWLFALAAVCLAVCQLLLNKCGDGWSGFGAALIVGLGSGRVGGRRLAFAGAVIGGRNFPAGQMRF